MKKLLLTALFSAMAVFLTASEYNFMALGDIHFDGEAYHTSTPELAHRRKERERNLSMWKSGKSDQVLAAAAKQLTAASSWLIRKGPHHRLSVRNPSIKALPKPYQAT